MMKQYLLLFMLGMAQLCFGQTAGTLDSGFGAAGIATTAFGISNSEAFAVAVQPDGKIITAGNYTTGGNAKIAFVRYSSAGVIDPTFGTNGKLQINTSTPSIIRALYVLPNGNIMAGGVMGSKPVLVRITSAGVADATFGMAGILAFDGGLNGINDLKFEGGNTGKIIGCGKLTTGPTDLVVFRLNADGTPDATFGTAGFAKAPTGGNLVTATRVQFQGDKIIVAGYFNSVGTSQKAICMRLNKNGTVDNTFGTAGKFVSAFGNTNEFADNMTVAPDKKIVLSGRQQVGSVQTLCFRLTENGTLDNTFGTNGKVNFAVGATADECQGLVVQGDGKVVLAGNTAAGAGKNAFIMRLTKAGAKDATFGTAGQTIVTSGAISSINGLFIQPDKKILAAGIATPTGNTGSFSTFRFNGGTYTSTEEPSLVQNAKLYPNPAAAGSELQLDLEMRASDVAQVTLFGLDGQQVALLQPELTLAAGKNQVQLRVPASVSAGMYVVRVTGKRFQHQEMLILE
jgi:uncharacterized delta-60 repeat protein